MQAPDHPADPPHQERRQFVTHSRRVDRSEADPLSGLHYRRDDRSHHPLAGLLSLDAAVRRLRNLRVEYGRSHSEPDQSAGLFEAPLLIPET